jgi:penicillin-binding protein 2
MPKDHDKQRVFTRRAIVLTGLQTLAFGGLTARLAYLQFIKSGEYGELAENNHIKLQPVPAERGLILDRFGIPIADNEKVFRLLIDPSGLTRQAYETTLDQLNKLLEIPDKKWEQLTAVRPSSATPPQTVKDSLSWEEVSLVELHTLALPGVSIEASQLRHYPLGEKVAHLTGYMGAASEEEMKRDGEETLLRLPDFKIGKNGVEKMLERRLRGQAGIRKLEVNVKGVVVREAGRSDSNPGENVRLTIDIRAHEAAASKLEGQSGSAVALDVENGNVLVLASMPAYDPNAFSRGILTAEWNKLAADKKIPLLNKAIGGLYPPGSTFKMMVGMAGLEKEVIKPGFSVYCPGYFMLGDHRFGCWKPGGHGRVDYHQAIEQSCDTFFYTVANHLGVEPTASISHRFGLGASYNLGLIGERAGIVPDSQWKMKTYKQEWTMGDTINCSIGQGYVINSPIELAVMVARIASGKKVVPRLIVPPGEPDPVFAPIDIDPKILEDTRVGMTMVVNSPSGTAHGSAIHEPGMEFAGKTGTSQVRKLIALGINQNTLPWEARHHGLFVGYAPLDKPKYAVGVVVEHGGGGAAAAAPVAKEVLLALQKGAAEAQKPAGQK